MKRFIVWVDYGSEGWAPMFDCDDFDEAAQYWSEHNENGRAILTENCRPIISRTVYKQEEQIEGE